MIKLTSTNTTATPIYVAPAFIRTIEPIPPHDMTRVTLADNHRIIVEETPEQILKLIGDSNTE